MDKNLIWKIVLILLVVVASGIYVWPPQEKLKQGLDLAGGTSLIYEIDTTDLAPHEQKDLAQNMIPILLKRIDPTHVANLVMRPQGDTRIEIQLPVASAETRRKRDALEQSIDALEQENINLLKIRQALALPAEQRQAEFEKYAANNERRREILKTLADVYDQRTAAQKQRDAIGAEMAKIDEQLTQVGLNTESLGWSIGQWIGRTPEQRQSEIETYVKANLQKDGAGELTDTQRNAVTLINRSIDLQKERNPIVESLTEPENGLNVQWNKAIKDLARLNLDIDSVESILDLPAGSPTRKDKLEAFKTDFPDRANKIQAVIAAYDDYRVVGGRLDDPEDLKRMLKGSGVLEFRILPTGEEITAEQAQAYREELNSKGPKAASDSRYVWMPVEDDESSLIQGITGQFGEKVYVLCSNQPNETMLQSGDKKWTLKKAYPTTDEQGRRAIGFTFDDVAANKFFAITSNNIGKPLCILLDNVAISAPNINSAIRSSGIIMGTYTPTQITDMVNKLNAGSFPARLSELPISEKSISATIGADNRNQGIQAGIIGVISVAAFLLAYYMLSGIITVVALILNLVILLAAMVLLDATFTLPGIAGLILTFGMSDDANVLINERIREEQRRGSSVKAAISNGYSRAFSTIFDSNITTFGVAAILYMVASEEIKGFAIVLMLGIAISMFTGLFVTRVILDFMTSRRIVTKPLSMFGIFQNVNVNWMNLRPVFLTLSLTMVLAGLGVFFFRDEAKTGSKYDIEFIGGTSVEIELKEGSGFDRAAVEQRINKILGNARVYEVGKKGNRFEITTTLTNNITADLQFASAAGQTVQGVTDLIIKAGDTIGRPLSNLTVTDKGNGFYQITTSRVNAGVVEEVLNSAVGESASVGNIQVHEIVSDAIREAFHEYLSIKENLGLTFEKEERIEVGSEDAAVLSDYLGGLKITASLKNSATLKDLDERFTSLRYRNDLQDIKWYRYAILKPDLTQPGENEQLTSFVYVSSHPEAGYRELDSNEWQAFASNEKAKLQEAASLESSLAKVTQIDPSIGAQAKQKAIVAIILSLLAIVAYIWVRFGTARYGLAAIVALVHDVSITLGLVTASVYIAGTPIGRMLGIQDFKINMEMIAAFLTIIGYSLNDTIVVFDRIRENRGRLSVVTPELITTSINQTLSRTTLTSFTTWLAVFVMYVWGGEGLRGFTFAMMVGIVVGTYSSIAIAAPILLLGKSSRMDQGTAVRAKTVHSS